MDFGESPDYELLRDAVAGVARRVGHDYHAACAREDHPTDGLWQAVADHGFLAVHLPEEWGGGGGGMAELAIVCEELAEAGSPRLAAGSRAGREGRLRHHRARRRLQQP